MSAPIRGRRIAKVSSPKREAAAVFDADFDEHCWRSEETCKVTFVCLQVVHPLGHHRTGRLASSSVFVQRRRIMRTDAIRGCRMVMQASTAQGIAHPERERPKLGGMGSRRRGALLRNPLEFWRTNEGEAEVPRADVASSRAVRCLAINTICHLLRGLSCASRHTWRLRWSACQGQWFVVLFTAGREVGRAGGRRQLREP